MRHRWKDAKNPARFVASSSGQSTNLSPRCKGGGLGASSASQSVALKPEINLNHII